MRERLRKKGLGHVESIVPVCCKLVQVNMFQSPCIRSKNVAIAWAGWACGSWSCASCFSLMLLLKFEPCPRISYLGEKSDSSPSITAFGNPDHEIAEAELGHQRTVLYQEIASFS